MPRLNPAPWFMVFILIWTFLIALLTKTLNNTPHLLAPQCYKEPHNNHWTWPWS